MLTKTRIKKSNLALLFLLYINIIKTSVNISDIVHVHIFKIFINYSNFKSIN